MKNLAKKGKDLFERLTTLKVVRRPEFPFLGFRRRFIKLRLDITKGCNLRCVMCPTVAEGDFEKYEMPPDLFDRIAKEVFPRTEHLTIGCGAEPLLSKNFDRYLRSIGAFDIPYTLIISNGSLLTEEKIVAMLDAGIDELSISLESANKEIYESVRVGAKYDRLLGNIRRFNELKAERGSDVPLLSFNTVLMKSTLPELRSVIELAETMGASAFSMGHLIPFAGLENEQESLYYHQEIANEKIEETRKLAESLGIRVYCPPLFGSDGNLDLRGTEKGVGGLACVQPWTFMVITARGDVSPCSWLYGEKEAGSFKEQSFRQIWFGDLYTRLRKEIQTGNLRPRCTVCPAAGRGDIDRKESFQTVYL